jgi:hypothetical protein
MAVRALWLVLSLASTLLPGGPSPASAREFVPVDTLSFAPVPEDSTVPDDDGPVRIPASTRWLKPSSGDHLLTDPDEWRAREDGWKRIDLLGDYNRVDRFRLGLGAQIQGDRRMLARLGARLDYAFDRKQVLYGLQIEQPVVPPGRIALGVSMVRRTDHQELQQVENIENSLALLFGRQDYRDYFEREGFGTYLAWRVPDFSTVSVHLRSDEYRSLPAHPGTRSFFHRGRLLRENPPIDDGESHASVLRLERIAHPTELTRAGVYHWIDVERSGHGLGGDFEYTRLIADLRSVFRLSPSQTFALRGVAGRTFDGVLPAQKRFVLGGPDGLRAHRIGAFSGDQLLLGQAEYTIGLWPVRSTLFDAGLHALAFVDFGHAWSSPRNRWDLGRQRIAADGGFGLATAEDNLRVYFGKDLAEPDSDFLVSMRLHRPF